MTKSGTLELNTIHQGNCVDLLMQTPDHSIDLRFADPPYNLQLRTAVRHSVADKN